VRQKVAIRQSMVLRIGDALRAEGTVVQGGGQGEGIAAGREDLEVGELAVDALCFGIRPKALEDLAEDEVSEA